MEIRPKNYAKKRQFLWTDLPDAKESLQRNKRRFATDESTLGYFIEHGYAVVQSAVSSADVDRFLSDLHSGIDKNADLQMTYWDVDADGVSRKHQERATKGKITKAEAKILDVHTRLASSQTLIFSPKILAFLRDVFAADPVAFQTLYFENGSEQGAHQDTAFVYTDPPYQFVASWIALEDISEGSGELFYYPKSQKLDDLIFASGSKALVGNDPDAPRYSQFLETLASEKGLQRERFLPKKGDVLFWASDLIHGGQPRVFERTRRSLVTHYCPRTAIPPYARASGAKGTQLKNGAWVLSQY